MLSARPILELLPQKSFGEYGHYSGWNACDDFSGGVPQPRDNLSSEYFLAKSTLPESFFDSKIMEQESIPMEVVNPQRSGIDIGSRSHWVAVGQSEQDVREFGIFNQDLFAMLDWLKGKNVRTIGMESTGTYCQNLYAILISKGFQVIFCNGKFTKNIKGKKTDIKDCLCIQKLHILGLFAGSFFPDGKTEELRTYCKHRCNPLHAAASASKKM